MAAAGEAAVAEPNALGLAGSASVVLALCLWMTRRREYRPSADKLMTRVMEASPAQVQRPSFPKEGFYQRPPRVYQRLNIQRAARG